LPPYAIFPFGDASTGGFSPPVLEIGQREAQFPTTLFSRLETVSVPFSKNGKVVLVLTFYEKTFSTLSSEGGTFV